jgi:ligand-binding SRPBCC domain-containing protein
MRFVKESVIPASVEAVFAFHERPDAFEVLLPPWDTAEVVQPPAGLEVGTRVIVKTKVGPFWSTIEAEHVEYERNRVFTDVMNKGPFAKWRHRHLFFEHPDGCRLRDEIEYEPPLGVLGRLVEPFAIRPRLEKMFEYRHEVTRREVLAAAGQAKGEKGAA